MSEDPEAARDASGRALRPSPRVDGPRSLDPRPRPRPEQDVGPEAELRALGRARLEPSSVDEGPRRVRCQLTTLTPERALSRALVQHLSEELRGIDFQLGPAAGEEPPDAVWICGYRPGHAGVVAALRRKLPHATLIVTGRGPLSVWTREVRAAGADAACTWPLPYHRLGALLRGGRRSSLREA